MIERETSLSGLRKLFRKEYPYFDEYIEDSYLSGKYELTVILNDGRKLVYSGNTHTVKFMVPYKEYRETVAYPYKEDVNWSICRNIERLIARSGLTYKEIADRTFTTTSYIESLAKGHKSLKPFMIKKLAMALDCTETELMYIEPQ